MFGLASVYKDEASAGGQGDMMVETRVFGVDGIKNPCPTRETEVFGVLGTSDASTVRRSCWSFAVLFGARG